MNNENGSNTSVVFSVKAENLIVPILDNNQALTALGFSSEESKEFFNDIKKELVKSIGKEQGVNALAVTNDLYEKWGIKAVIGLAIHGLHDIMATMADPFKMLMEAMEINGRDEKESGK